MRVQAAAIVLPLCLVIASLRGAAVARVRALDAPPNAEACRVCGWRPPSTRLQVVVSTPAELQAAVKLAKPDTTIVIQPGVYHLIGALDITVPNVVLRGAGSDRADVVLRGDGMSNDHVRVGISIGAPHVTIANLSVGDVAFHGVQIRGERGASGATLHGLRIFDTGQQLVKGSFDRATGTRADRGLVACSRLEYTEHAPSDYTNGIDVIGVRDWVIRDNDILRIQGPAAVGRQAGPAILVWGGSAGTVVERNLIRDAYRGIAFGIGPEPEHQGGIIRNNVIWNLQAWGDEGIELNGARDVRVDHNTVFVDGGLPWSIKARFGSTSASIRNNLTNRGITTRNGARADVRGNVDTARAAWFVNLGAADLHIARGATLPAAAVPLDEVIDDFDRAPRVAGRAGVVGAFQSAGGRIPAGAQRPGGH